MHVLLHDTVIFPEGGGQPTDTGLITTVADNATWEVIQCKRHGGHAVHYVKLLPGLDVDAALLAFQPGAKVTVALGDAGYERRYDHVCSSTFSICEMQPHGALSDVYAYVAAYAICAARDASRSPNTFLVSNKLPQPMLYRGSQRHDAGRDRLDSSRGQQVGF